MSEVLTGQTAGLSETARLLLPFRQDFEYYAPRCLKIRTKSGGIEPFRMNRAQRYLHQKIEEQRARTGKVRIIGLKGRQQGFSTYVEGRYYQKTSMAFGKRAVILTHLDGSTAALFEMTQRYHENCPALMRPKTSAASAKELHFSDLDSGYLVATAGSKGVGRGWGGVQYFHGSEVAFWPNAEDHLAAIGQTVPNASGTEIIFESTANGVGNLFHSMWQDAERGKSEFEAIFVPWFWQDEYRLPVPPGFVMDADEAEYAELYDLDLQQVAWRRVKIRDEFRGDVSLFDQEYPATPVLAFQRVAGDPLIPAKLVQRARKCGDVEARGAKIMGVDMAEYGDDDSVITKRQGRKVHPQKRYHHKSQIEVANLAAKEAQEWGDVTAIMVDVGGGYGSTVVDLLIEWGLPAYRVNFGERAIEDALFLNRRSEMWGDMKAFLEDSPCQLPDDDVLEAEIAAPQYTYDSSRRLVLESKEKMKARGIKSPDGADSLALTFAYKVSPNAEQAKGGLDRTRVRSNWRT